MSELLGPAGGRVFVDRRGAPEAVSVLYVHGGPAQGCWDFMGSVGDLLAEDFDVVATDQPGVLRSDPLPADVVVDTDLLPDSYEDVRRRLGSPPRARAGDDSLKRPR